MERYKQVCKQISEQINPSDEFMEDLRINLNKRVTEEKMKRKNYLYKVAMIFCTLTLVSSGAFAMDIGNWLSQIFSNTDKSMQIAVENGYVQNVDMDYVEHDGIAIKVNSLVIDDKKINIVFDVQGEINGDLTIKELEVSTQGDEYANENLQDLSTLYNREFKTIEKNSHLLIINMSNVEQDLNSGEFLNIIINGLYIKGKDNYAEENKNIWTFNIKLEEDNFKNSETLAIKYKIEENEYIENYEITTTNTGTNIQLYFKSDFDKHNLVNKDNIYVETENGKKYVCRDWCRTKDNMIKINLPITTYDNLEKFNIVLNLKNEKIIFNANKENS